MESFQEKWDHIKAKVKTFWPKLTDKDIQEINGQSEKLYDKLYEKYGWKYSQVKDEIRRLELSLLDEKKSGKKGDIQSGSVGERTSRRDKDKKRAHRIEKEVEKAKSEGIEKTERKEYSREYFQTQGFLEESKDIEPEEGQEPPRRKMGS